MTVIAPERAVAELLDAAAAARLGTAFVVSRRLAITAFHCVRDVEPGRRVAVHFPEHAATATIIRDDSR